MNNQAKKVLEKVLEITYSEKYSKNKNRDGSGFNVFKVLKLSNAEDRTHSAFIAELLNPSGSHNKGGLFLEKFIEQLKTISEKNIERSNFFKNFSPKGAKVFSPHFICKKYQDNNTSGSIDILIENNEGDKCIIIENKIQAQDQEKQLERYYNYGIKKYKNNGEYNFSLIYLTLDGKTPSKKSSGELDESNYQTMSYSRDILDWLGECHEKINTAPLAVIILQYINLVRALTNKIIDSEMEKEIVEQLIKEPSYFDGALSINKSLPEAKEVLIKKFNEFFKEKAKGLEIMADGDLTGAGDSSKIWFSKEGWESEFCLCFSNRNFKDFWIGVAKNQKKEDYEPEEYIKLKGELKKGLKAQFDIDTKPNTKYAWTGYAREYFPRDWADKDIWIDIIKKNETLKSNVENLLESISTTLDNIYLK